LNEKKLQPGKIQSAPVKSQLDPIPTSRDGAGKKEIQPKSDSIPSTEDGAGKDQIQQGREEKEIKEKEKEKTKSVPVRLKKSNKESKSTASGQVGKEKKPTTPAKSGQDKPGLNKNEIQQSSLPENPDKSEGKAISQGKSEKENK